MKITTLFMATTCKECGTSLATGDDAVKDDLLRTLCLDCGASVANIADLRDEDAAAVASRNAEYAAKPYVGHCAVCGAEKYFASKEEASAYEQECYANDMERRAKREAEARGPASMCSRCGRRPAEYGSECEPCFAL